MTRSKVPQQKKNDELSNFQLKRLSKLAFLEPLSQVHVIGKHQFQTMHFQLGITFSSHPNTLIPKADVRSNCL